MNTYQKFLQKSHKVERLRDFRELVYRSAEQYAESTAFKLREKDISYQSLKMDYQALCTTFIDKGYQGKRIAIAGANSYCWILTYLAAATVGVAVPIDKELTAADIDNFIEAAECVAVFADGNILKNIQQGKEIDKYTINGKGREVPVEKLVENGSVLYTGGNKTIDTMEIDPDELHVLIFTSGTTGNAKGVCLSQTNICANIFSTASMVKINPLRQTLSVLPIHHTYESTLGHLLILSGGGRISYSDGLRYVGKNITEYQPTVIIAVPLLLEFMLRTIDKTVRKSLPAKYTKNPNLPFAELLKKLPLPLRLVVKSKVRKSLGGKLKLLIVGAAAIKPEVIEAFGLLGITTYQGYGLTECSPLLAGNNDFFQNIQSCGLPVPGVRIQIENPDEDGVGEIVAKGDNIMLGYYNDPETTAEIMRGGWFHTGDLGYIDEEGWLYITGRCKSVIVTQNGKNIYPEELEARLLDEKIIAEVVVVATQNMKGDGEAVKAKIYPDFEMIKEVYQGAVESDEAIEMAVKDAVEAVNDQMPNYKRISVVEIMKEPFEKTTTKKIKRFGANVE
jgi:long-chain acyl-CoA synthetase